MLDNGTEKNFKMSETQGKLNEFTKCLDRDIGKRQRTPKSRVSTSQEGSLLDGLELTMQSRQAFIGDLCTSASWALAFSMCSTFANALAPPPWLHARSCGFKLHPSKEANHYKV